MRFTIAANKYGAGFVSRIADGNNEVEINAMSLREVLRALGRVGEDVDADFSHGADGEQVEAIRIGPGGVGVDEVSAKSTSKAFGHLAATGIARAQEENVWKCVVHGGYSMCWQMWLSRCG